MRKIIGAKSVPCGFCGAEAGEECRRVYVGNIFGLPHGYHGQRIYDADLAQRTMGKLIGEE